MNKFIKICMLLWLLLFFVILIKNNQIKNDLTDRTIVQEINKNQSRIENLTCQISTKQPMATSGFLAYEKKYNFRFTLDIRGSKRLDLGSNENFLWFFYEPFSKKLHFWEQNKECDVIHEFNPEFIKEIFFYTIPSDSISLKSKQDYKIINFIKINGYLIKKIIVIKNNQVSECLFFNQEEELEIKCEIIENQKIKDLEFPKKIKLISKKIGSIEIEIENVKINQNIDAQIWSMPKMPSKKISK